jgi:hypothetical protein
MNIGPHWQQECLHRWHRWSDEPNMFEEAGHSATVELSPEMLARLPGFKDKWVYTCWIKEECGVLDRVVRNRQSRDGSL